VAFSSGELFLDPNVERLDWSAVAALTARAQPPLEVYFNSAEVGRHGQAVERLLAWCAEKKIRVAFLGDEPGDYESVLASLLGVAAQNEEPKTPLAEALSFSALRNEDVYLAGLYDLLERSYSSLASGEGLLRHLLDVLALFCETSLVVFSVKKAFQLRLLVGGEAARDERQVGDFLEFCKDDILRHDRFVDLETLEMSFLNPVGSSTEVSAGISPSRPGSISSYASFPLIGSDGRFVGLLHLGSTKNRDFHEGVLARLRPLLPLFGGVVALALERRDLADRRNGLLSLFSKFLPGPVIERQLKERKLEGSTGKRSRVVVLFSDIRSFTSITERNGAEPVVQFLNRHFQAMVTQIIAEGGVVDKFIGDAIVAVFNADEDETTTCARAVRSARAMLDALASVDVSGVVLDGGKYGIGVGIHVGYAISGSIGSREKMAFTVVGNVIERAEELEAETKHYHVGMLVSHAVASALTGSDLKMVDLTDEMGIPDDEHVFTLEAP
jgi:class 3 adenylate cyclase